MNILLNLTFYVGSNDPEDTDKELYLIEHNGVIKLSELKNIIKTANELCSAYEDCDEDDEQNEYPSYEDGLNVNTLMECVGILLKGDTITQLTNGDNDIDVNMHIDKYWEVMQWQ